MARAAIIAISAFLLALLAAQLSPAAAQAIEPGPIDRLSEAAAEPGTLAARIVQIFLLVTVLSIAPGIAMTVTCLPFMLVVLSILRQGIGLQQAPPNMLIVSVALFLTYFVMEPVFQQSWTEGVKPWLDGDASQTLAFQRTMEPFRGFMEARTSPEAIEVLAASRPVPAPIDATRPGLSLLIPAFVLSEIQRAFEIGFVILLPFLIIDLLVASVLMAMGMMMAPPSVVALPFKIAFFVLTNGWVAVSGALVRGYS